METRTLKAADIGTPVPGLYRMRLVRGGVFVPVSIRVTGERDEAGDLIEDEITTVEVNGVEARPEHVDRLVERANLSGVPIDKAEYAFLIADTEWAMEYAPDEPRANPGKAIDIAAIPPITP